MQFSLKKLEKYVAGVMPHYCSIKIVPRTLPMYIDKILSGEVRFASKCGNSIAVIEPNVISVLSEDSLVLQSDIQLNKVHSWFVPGSVVYFDLDYETCIIEDVSYDTNVIILKNGLKNTHVTGSKLVLLAVPITVSSNSIANTYTINVNDDYFFAIGDQIIIELVSGLFSSAITYSVNSTTYNPSSSSYTLVLDKPINRSLTSGETIYLKANPAYSSNIILVPTGSFSVNRNGPCLIDYLSGRLNEGTTIEEFLSVQVFSQFNDMIIGTTYSPELISKNYIMAFSSIRPDSMLFWDLVEGSFQYSNNDVAILLPDYNGRFSCYKDIIPTMENGQEWIIPVKSNSDVKFMCKFHSIDESVIFNNDKLINFTYSSTTGLITYLNPVNLDNVVIGSTFIDSLYNEYLVYGVNVSNYEVLLSSGLNVDCSLPESSICGSIRTGNPRRHFNLLENNIQNILVGTNIYETGFDRIELSVCPSVVVRNSSFINFTYNSNTGIIQYASYIDLSDVKVGQYFIDCEDNHFKISGKNETIHTLQLDIGLNVKCNSTIKRSSQGSVLVDYSNLQVEVGEWSLNSQSAFSISYNIVARSKDNWMSTGLILKNMFNSIDDISASYDSYQNLNGGCIMM